MRGGAVRDKFLESGRGSNGGSRLQQEDQLSDQVTTVIPSRSAGTQPERLKENCENGINNASGGFLALSLSLSPFLCHFLFPFPLSLLACTLSIKAAIVYN